MLKKIRCFYWKRRDRGRGVQCIAGFAVVIVCCIALLAWMVFRISAGFDRMSDGAGAVSGAAVSGEAVSGEAVTGSAVSSGAVTYTEISATVTGGSLTVADGVEVLPEDSQTSVTEAENEPVLNTDGLSVFLGFMTEGAYEKMISLITPECEAEGAAILTKMSYQKTDTKTNQVTSYVLSDRGTVWQISYSLKNSAVTVKKTGYSETQVNAMQKAAEKKEEAKLKKEQEKTKKKQSAKKKKSKTKKKKKTLKDVG